jgi:probable F420-dependent oxidoreductase
MTVAVAAWDLQELSGGRFALGLGSQVRGNLIGRYSTSWTAPAPRMREYVQSLHAIFHCWQEGTRLDFQGEHYQFTRMQPFFKPDPIEHPRIPLYTGGIGPRMVELAGEISDGLMTHPTNTAPRYLREVILPRIARGAKRAGRDRAEVELMVGPLSATGPDAETLAARREETRQLLSFLYSTPSYRPSLALFGWEERGEKLHALSRAGDWNEMAGIIDDEMLATLAPSGTYDQIVGVLREWYADLSDWITFPMPEDPTHDAAAAEVIAALRTGASA